MAVVTAGVNVALNMGTLQIGDWYGPTVTANAYHVAYNPTSGEYADFYGSFSYNSAGKLYAGYVDEIELSYNGKFEFEITGLDIDAPTLFSWIYYNDTDYALSTMFSGADTFKGSDKADWLESFGGNDFLYGYGGDDDLYGGSGNDYIDGGAGSDYMYGGTGNDVFIVNATGDRVFENSGEGFDLVKSSVSFSLDGGFIEDLTLTGSANINATGSSFANILIGNSGNNILDGRAGADKMTGGLGHDVYIVDNAKDLVVERSNEGFDLVKASVSYTLGAYVEDLTLTGKANLNGTGNSYDNILTGNSGANLLDGKAGADKMIGGLGNDVYIVDNAKDLVVEKSNEGFDLVKSSVSHTLGAYVEDLTLTGSAAINATGNSYANIIIGNAGANRIDGDAGADLLTGGSGRDTFVYGATTDSKVSAFDRITDLSSSDRIDLSAIDANTKVSGNQAFSIVDAFTKTAGQMTLDYSASTKLTTILMDVNGDGVADMKIVANGNHEGFDNFVF